MIHASRRACRGSLRTLEAHARVKRYSVYEKYHVFPEEHLVEVAKLRKASLMLSSMRNEISRNNVLASIPQF